MIRFSSLLSKWLIGRNSSNSIRLFEFSSETTERTPGYTSDLEKVLGVLNSNFAILNLTIKDMKRRIDPPNVIKSFEFIRGQTFTSWSPKKYQTYLIFVTNKLYEIKAAAKLLDEVQGFFCP